MLFLCHSCFRVLTQITALHSKLSSKGRRCNLIRCFNGERIEWERDVNGLEERKTGQRMEIQKKWFPIEFKRIFPFVLLQLSHWRGIYWRAMTATATKSRFPKLGLKIKSLVKVISVIRHDNIVAPSIRPIFRFYFHETMYSHTLNLELKQLE
jgi:hypothetical protein